MKIKELRIENFRGIESDKFLFDAQSVILFGINGAENLVF